MELLLSLCLGVSLSAACGFRVFVPLLLMSLAANMGHLELGEGFLWMASTPALFTFAVATVFEVGAYYFPWLDNLLDSAASPLAVVAGTVVTASVVTDVSPLLKWTLAAVAGGGTAGAVQGGTVAMRGISSLTTGGFGNVVIATGEWISSVLGSVLAFFLPILGAILALCAAGLGVYLLLRLFKLKRSGMAQPT